MKVIGITGGVGAGKSEILSYIRERYNCRILLADEAAHKVKEKGQPCYEKLVTLLSDEILDETGNINKVKMAETIFSFTAFCRMIFNICAISFDGFR